MNNIAIAKETIKITAQRSYILDGKEIKLPEGEYEKALVFSPKMGEELLKKNIPQEGELCRISVTTEDSFQAAHRYENAFVMNFANAHNAGGGFTLGANAQEEALCRCSTLYASIHSAAASEMYRYNNTHLRAVESDYMIYSPKVCVFRNEKCELIEEPFFASVITVPAPNRHGAALFASNKTIKEAMMRRIRIMLMIAAENSHKSLILGAWGCGAFGNKPAEVAQYFREILIDEGFGRMFDEVCFAVYGKKDGRNYKAFREAFA